MNKYQRALYYFRYKCLREIESDEMANILQELTDKATPKKPALESMCFLGDMAKHLVCPICHSPIVNVWSTKVYKPQYCHYCGQALKWWEEDGDEE